MCGIYGFTGHNDTEKKAAEILTAMGGALTHRGPDHSGQMIDGAAALGHRRLSIIDLSENGSQPMSNEDGSVWIVFNGEIYNHRGFRDNLKSKGHTFRSRTDTEVIVHLYEEYGIDCLSKLNGMFAFTLWDKKKNEFFLVRDRMGIKPLHYAETPRGIVFASEIKALLRHPDISREIDWDALNEYLSFEFVPAPRSIYKQIRKLLPGCYLHMRKGVTTLKQYWQIDYQKAPVHRTEGEYAEELLALLKASVRRRLTADVPVGAFLSGGIDSSAICALIQMIAPNQIRSFSIGFEDATFDESAEAARTVAYLGIPNERRILTPERMLDLVPRVMDYLDEPFGDASFIPTLLLSRFAREQVTVTLSGDGGDELFAGYPTYLAHCAAPVYRRIPSLVRAGIETVVNRLPTSDNNMSYDFLAKRFVSAAADSSPARRNYRWIGSFSPAEKTHLLTPDIDALVRQSNAYGVAEDYYRSCAADTILERLLSCDQRFYLQDDILVKTDRATMAASLEGRVPFLDHTIVAFAVGLPAHLKLHHLTTKYILKKAVSRYLPKQVIRRRKKGFGIPFAKWLKQELKPFVTDMFQEKRIKRQGVFNPDAVSRLLKEHLEGCFDHRKKLYTLLSFQLWYEKYVSP